MKASKKQVAKWQEELVKTGHQCPVDGDPLSKATKEAVRDYQESKGLPADGLLGPVTGAALDLDTAPPFDAADHACYPAKLDRAFFDALHAVEVSQHIPGEALMLVMQHESGLDPQAQFVGGGTTATGLIQFVFPKRLGWDGTVQQFREATAAQQVPYVGKFFAALNGCDDPLTLHQYCFVPASLRRGSADDSVVICAKDGQGYGGQEDLFYRMNKALDRDNNGAITRGDLRKSLYSCATNNRYLQACKVYRSLYPKPSNK